MQKKLKSLSNFEIENSVLDREQLKLVTGGIEAVSNQTECRETCNNNVEDSEERGRRDHPDGSYDEWSKWMKGACTCYQIIHTGC
jgi:hypothetical protein